MIVQAFALLIPIVSVIAVFAFVSVANWADARTKEREAFYRSEVYKKLADSTGPQVQQVLAVMREQERNTERKGRDGLRLGGLVVTLVGIGLIAMLTILEPKGSVWAVGLIPLAVGTALLLYADVLAPPLPTQQTFVCGPTGTSVM